MLEDTLLVWQFNAGRLEALHRIYLKYRTELVTLAASLLTDIQMAEDVVHDVFVGFINCSGRFRLTGSLKGYLSTCVANAARNYNKAIRIRRSAGTEPLEAKETGLPSPLTEVLLHEEFARLAKALGQLPYEQREALLLHIRSGMSFAAIAALQGVPVNTTRGRYRYALEKMRTLLADDQSGVARPLPETAV